MLSSTMVRFGLKGSLLTSLTPSVSIRSTHVSSVSLTVSTIIRECLTTPGLYHRGRQTRHLLEFAIRSLDRVQAQWFQKRKNRLSQQCLKKVQCSSWICSCGFHSFDCCPPFSCFCCSLLFTEFFVFCFLFLCLLLLVQLRAQKDHTNTLLDSSWCMRCKL